MKITIRDASMMNGTTVVVFDSVAGPAAGTWRSRDAPVLLAEYDAEFHLDGCLEDFLREGPATKAGSTTPSYRLDLVDDPVRMEGSLEGMDEDGMVYFRLDGTCLMMIESRGSRSVGERLTLELDRRALLVWVLGG